jgi:hypothetical protein
MIMSLHLNKLSHFIKPYYFLSAIACFAGLSLSAQNKFESEQRIDRSKVPAPALRFVDSFTHEKVKWYLETGLTSTTVEAKFKKEKRKYSIEFDSIGEIEDVEIVLSENELSVHVKRAIQGHLDSSFQRSRLRKVQIQFRGDALKMKQLAIFHLDQIPIFSRDLKVRYEIELKGKPRGERPRLYEYTFNEKGNFLFRKTIVFRNADHLEY